MTAHDDAKKAAEAATRDRAAAYDLTDVEHRRFVRDAVDAAAPILLADAKLIFETLTVTSKAREEQVERLIAEVARWKALVDAKQSWIDGAKVDLAAAEEEAERLRRPRTRPRREGPTLVESAIAELLDERDAARAALARFRAALTDPAAVEAVARTIHAHRADIRRGPSTDCMCGAEFDYTDWHQDHVAAAALRAFAAFVDEETDR